MKTIEQLYKEIEILKKENTEMRLLSTHEGYMQLFFKELHNFKNHKECFYHLETLHTKYFGSNKYSDYAYFMRKKAKYLKTDH